MLAVRSAEKAVLGKDFEIEDTDNTALILYTSGTTGKPKGVVLSFQNLLYNIKTFTETIRIYRPEDKILTLLPVHHIFPLVGTIIAPFHIGAKVVMAPSIVPQKIMEILQQHQPDMLLGVPRLYEAFHRNIMNAIGKNILLKFLFFVSTRINNKTISSIIFNKIQKTFGNLRYLISGGSKLDEKVYQDMTALGFEMLEGYGLTETAPLISFNRPGKARAGSPGQPAPGLQVKIEQDEIAVEGENIMKGYYNLPDKTREVIKDGWFHTSDLGYIDEDGYLFITGRKKEILVLPNGENVNPPIFDHFPGFIG
jgi:long-chain acyl-CoA synthetase